MGPQLTHRNRLTTREVAEALAIDSSPSDLVAIDVEQLERIARHIMARSDFDDFSSATWDDDHFWNPHDPQPRRSQFFAVGNAINFRFWKLETGRVTPSVGIIDGREYRGAMFMWRALRSELDRGRGRILDAGFLSELTLETLDAIFVDDSGSNPMGQGSEDRVANLRDLGQQLLAHWDGSFFNVVEASDGSLVEFAALSKSFRAFDDPLYKLTMLNAILHSGGGVYRFYDHPLPAIDYHLLRHALRQGILRPTAPLAEKLRRQKLLTAEEAQELRRLALVAFVELSERTRLSGELLDNKFWLNRTNCTDFDPVCLDERTASRCPFYGACIQAVEFGRPLEITRYY
jgi:hypothetical protein